MMCFFVISLLYTKATMVWPMSIVLCLSERARLRALLVTIYLPSISISNHIIYLIQQPFLEYRPASGMLGPQERE